MPSQVQLTGKGGSFEIIKVPKSTPTADQILIRQRVIALNLIDAKQRDHGINISRWPHVLGIEGAGIIEAVGSDVEDLKVGDAVAGWQGTGALDMKWGGAFQEYVAVPASFVFKVPENIILQEAASVPICFVTAVCAIVNSLKIPLPFIPGILTEGHAPSSILVLGGSSATGAAAIQLLRTAYPTLPIITTSSPKHHAHLLSLGATSAIDYKSSSVVADLKAATPGGSGVDMIIDCVGAGTTQTNICIVFDPMGSKRYAAVVTGSTISVPDGVELVAASFYSMLHMQGGMQLIPSLTRLIEEGLYKVPLPVRVIGRGLEEIPGALDELKRVSGEKVVVLL